MRSSTLALCALVLATPCSAAFAQAPSAMQDQRPHGFLTPELRIMLRMEQPQSGPLTPEQRAGMRDEMRAKWAAMSDADRQKLRSDLQARWDALPATQKQMIEQRIAERRAQWQNQGQGQQQQQ
jgi:hypothetical protein